MRTTLARVLTAAAIVTLFSGLAPQLAAADLPPHETKTLVSCDASYCHAFDLTENDLRTAEISAYRLGPAPGAPGRGGDEPITVSAVSGLDKQGKYANVNLDKCTKGSVDECNADVAAWQTVASGPSLPTGQIVHDIGIFRACGAPIEANDKWLCTPAVNVHKDMLNSQRHANTAQAKATGDTGVGNNCTFPREQQHCFTENTNFPGGKLKVSYDAEGAAGTNLAWTVSRNGEATMCTRENIAEDAPAGEMTCDLPPGEVHMDGALFDQSGKVIEPAPNGSKITFRLSWTP